MKPYEKLSKVYNKDWWFAIKNIPESNKLRPLNINP